ncbi:uncharacterized protein JN550_013634 [Neoarthrinium moseri]|uniref:uncharacterized protein n=1 Tax=Neoarthrinium moseri TaxID=1658444 RepID=UPI001FDDE741|nr:uncharacterized protein JN550_013634 [Neoarthrinium moseri]KAI1856860.1 hypothetical protein JN550_013634 [Neoarthrinium moseri]
MAKGNAHNNGAKPNENGTGTYGHHHGKHDILCDGFVLYPCQAYGNAHARDFNNVDDVPFVLHPWALGPRAKSKQESGDAFVGTPYVADPLQVWPAVFAQEDAPVTAHKTPDTLAEQKLSQAARQLHDQAVESRKVYDSFHKDYRKDVKDVDKYVTQDIRQRIWEAKVERNRKYREKRAQEDRQLTLQRDKLASCLKNMYEATDKLPGGQSSAGGYDSRELHFEKLRATGKRVDRLAGKALSNEAACKDLVSELADLEHLVNPEESAAKILYRFDKRQKAAVEKDESDEESAVDGGPIDLEDDAE